MNTIEKISVEGFWGTRCIDMELFPDVNFLIGINGSGKTTLINLIAAALDADIKTLQRIPFNRISITLKEVGGPKKPSIVVEKGEHKDDIFSSGIDISIKEAASQPFKKYPAAKLEKLDALRSYQLYSRIGFSRKNSKSHVEQHLRKLVNVCWLSIHRTSVVAALGEDSSYESTVDMKLDDITGDLERYFSELSRKGSELLENFQERVFLSLLVKKEFQRSLAKLDRIGGANIKSALEDIFQQFSFTATSYRRQVDQHFELFEEGKRKFFEDEIPPEVNEVAAMFATLRIELLVEEWNKLISERNEILEPRTVFLESLNDMFSGKELRLNEKNELIAISNSGTEILPKNLSSGEKQLLIILGEALIQDKKPQIYIADEPELSLHVRWQEQLVSKIRKLNPNAQVFIATHSPDIVSTFGKHVFDMEAFLN